jgi:enoyl-CoA hydratase/carnithine racemase
MCSEFRQVWHEIRIDSDIHSVVLQANGDRAFCSGVDMKLGIEGSDNPWARVDPGQSLGPKQNDVWKPVVCAIHGMAAGGAMYWINESDIIICSDDATFFDPHLSFGMTSALEPIGFSRRVPIGEVMRWALLGLDERMSATRAREIGLVSEVVPRLELRARAHALAAKIAAKPPTAVQSTVKAIWFGQESGWYASQRIGFDYAEHGNMTTAIAAQRVAFETRTKTPYEIR